jgi:hypothetical protein
MFLRLAGEGEDLGARLLQQRSGLGEAALELRQHPGVLLADRVRVGLREDRAHHRGDEALRRLGDAREQIAHEVGAAALPGRTRQRGCDRIDEPGVGVRGHQEDAAEAPRDQAAQEGKPGGAVVLGDDVQAERLAEAVPVDGNGVDDAGVDGAAARAALDDERVEHQDG